MTEKNTKKGSIVSVGLGMTLGSHISPLSQSYIEKADIVFVAASHHLVEEWVCSMNQNTQSLQKYYGQDGEGKHRYISYREMVDAMMTEVRAGKRVVGAFYGHPGVFAWAPHQVIKEARAEGFEAHMEPGISAEDCLYADLGVDPGEVGSQHFEAGQFMLYKRKIDTSAYLILWQVGIAGDQSKAKFYTDNSYREILTELLLEHYPADHMVAIYECPILPIGRAKIEWFPLKDFAQIGTSQNTTMLIPPCKELEKNEAIAQRLSALDLKHT